MTYIPNITSKDPSSSHMAHVSHFGVLKAGPTVPVFKANFPNSALNTRVWSETVANSASTTVADGYASLDCGTNSAGSVSLESVDHGRFEAGQVTVWQSGVYANTGIADNTRIWGMRDASGDEGLYFKQSGTTFQVVAKKGGTETAVSSASFSGDTTFTPGASNSTYRIEYSAGRAIFYAASGGKKVLLHEMVNTSEPLVNTLDLGSYYENTNTGNTTSKPMRVRGSSMSIWGSDPGIQNEAIVYLNSSISADKYVVLVDLSDTTNFPHVAKNRVDIEHIKVSIDRANNSLGNLKIGVITRIDGTDADISYLFNVPFTVSDTRRILSINNFGSSSLKFGVSGGALTHAVTNSTQSNVAAVNTGATLDSPRGASTVTPAVGDVVMFLDHVSGSAWSATVELFYHTE